MSDADFLTVDDSPVVSHSTWARREEDSEDVGRQEERTQDIVTFSKLTYSRELIDWLESRRRALTQGDIDGLSPAECLMALREIARFSDKLTGDIREAKENLNER